jgi:UDP-glucuronate decarboxylase
MDDLIDGFLALMDTPPDFTGPVNIGNPGEFTIRQLADLVLEKTGSRSKLIQLPLPQDDPTQRKPDITLARSALNWEPRVGLSDGLDRTIDYFRSILLLKA